MNTLPEADLVILASLDFNLTCEDRGHNQRRRWWAADVPHTGDAAQWIFRGTCPTCGPIDPAFVCDGYKRQIEAAAKTLHHVQCDLYYPAHLWVLTFEPLRGGA